MVLNRDDQLTSLKLPDPGGGWVPPDRPVLIETAEVVRVDPDLWTCDLECKFSGRRPSNIEIGGLGVSRNGTMMGYMPQVGDKCIVAHLSDVRSPVILMFLPVVAQRGYARGRRKAMRPGDTMMSSESGNYVHVHAGGIVDIAADPVTRRIFIPLLHQIKDICENYTLETAGGEFRWKNRRDEKGIDGTPVELVYEVKEFSKGEVVLVLKQGNVTDVTDMPDRPVDHRAVQKDGEEVFRCTVDRAGNLKVTAASTTLEFTDDFDMTVEGEFNMSATGKAKLNGDSGVELANATEPAVLGTTLKTQLEAFLTGMSVLMDSLAATGAALAVAAQGPLAALQPGFQQIAPAVTTTKGSIETFKTSLAQALARDTKLS